MLLWLEAEEKGYKTDRWVTYKQAQDMGGQVRKGETCA
ncbi:ArdC-like ssDNA-binding domain-containing protein [Duffyella gerundensis]|nr:ArdC family protein [Duffyella gerundensis]